MKSAKGFSRLYVFVLIGLLSSFACGAGDTLLYDNSSLTGGWYPPYAGYEVCDFGYMGYANVTKIRFAYVTQLSSPGTITLRFYNDVGRFSYPYYPVKTLTFTGLPGSFGGAQLFYKEVELSESQQFMIGGNFGYSFQFTNDYTGPALASGGMANINMVWEYDDWYGMWDSFGFSNGYAGFYMQLFSGPSIDEITCDIKGYKFNDENGNGQWDDGEPALPRWEMYLDTNNDGAWQSATEPNVLTDPNGMYFFKNLDSPAAYTVREVMQEGWTQTLPGAPNYKYVIATEPNNVYEGYHFGNTNQPIGDIRLYGYVKTVDGIPIDGVRVATAPGSSASAFDYTDEEGYYEVTVPAPFTGSIGLTKAGWLQHVWSTHLTSWTMDFYQDFMMLYLYDGGDGSQANPFQIRTPEQLDFIGLQNWHWDQHFILTADIDLTGTDLHPIGISAAKPFEGSFDGNGFTLSNFSRAASADLTYASLFGQVNGATTVIKDLRMVNPHIDTPNTQMAAPLVSSLNQGTVTNCHVIGGSVTAKMYAGGLVAQNKGYNLSGEIGGTIENCSSSCDVNATSNGITYAGGLIGFHEGQVRRCFAAGDVSGFSNVGGLIGRMSGSNSSSPLNGDVQNCYASGSTSGSQDSVGGLIGYNYMADAEDCYTCGQTDNLIGGLCGKLLGGTFTTCYWDGSVSGAMLSNGGTGLPTVRMQSAATYQSAGWDLDTVWRICDGTNYPRLQWEPTLLADFACPDGVELNDLQVLADEWLVLGISAADMAPAPDGDGVVNLIDFAAFAAFWMEDAAY